MRRILALLDAVFDSVRLPSISSEAGIFGGALKSTPSTLFSSADGDDGGYEDDSVAVGEMDISSLKKALGAVETCVEGTLGLGLGSPEDEGTDD